MENTNTETQQTQHETGSEEWVEQGLAANRIKRFVISHAITDPQEQERTTRKKAKFLTVYEATLGTVKDCCKAVGINRWTFYNWRDTDPDFKAAIRQIDDHRTEAVEDHLYELIRKGDGPSVRWFLERTTEKYKARKILEHHTDDKTFEDEVDEIIKAMTAEERPHEPNHDRDQHNNAAPADEVEEAPEGTDREQAEDPQ